VEVNSTGGQGSRRAVASSDDDDDDEWYVYGLESGREYKVAAMNRFILHRTVIKPQDRVLLYYNYHYILHYIITSCCVVLVSQNC
jgi:hypothetical protein